MGEAYPLSDIEGVLFGDYNGAFQLRPGVNTWLEWAFEQFEVIWLTSWDQEKVKAFLTVTYNANVIAQFRYADWTNYANKTVWIAEALKLLGEQEVYWIDDEAVPVDGVQAIGVNPKGEHELIPYKRSSINSWRSTTKTEDGARTPPSCRPVGRDTEMPDRLMTEGVLTQRP